MVKVTEEKHAKFTKRISKNDIAPKDGSEPLTVIEFSLTNETRDSLKKALDEIKAAPPSSNDKFYDIIEDHFPIEVLDELNKLAKVGGAASTVYVVRNLPKDKIPDELLAIKKKQSRDEHAKILYEWSHQHTYASFIAHILDRYIPFEGEATYLHLKRYVGDGVRRAGVYLHKHKTPISLLAGILSDGSQTRFTDMQTVLEDDKAMQPIVRLAAYDSEDMNSIKVDRMPLAKLPDHLPNWKDAVEIEITPGKLFDIHKNRTAFENLIDKHSQRVTIDNGDLVMWAEDGRIMHQALPAIETNKPKDTLVRYLIGFAENRKTQER